MLFIIPIILAYLIGAIPFGLIIARLAGIKDIRQHGSGNIGATNVWRLAGFKVALWVFVGDIGKGVIAVLMARYYLANYQIEFLSADLFLVICAVVAILGHVFPIYLGFKGGKGVNTALGTMLTLLPYETLLSFAVFVLVLMIFKYVSLGSILAAFTMLIAVLVEKYLMSQTIAPIYIILCALLALLIVITHRSNISRLLSGTENRFSLKSKLNKGAAS